MEVVLRVWDGWRWWALCGCSRRGRWRARPAVAGEGPDAADGGRAQLWQVRGPTRPADGVPGCGGREGDAGGVSEAAGKERDAVGGGTPSSGRRGA